MKTTAVQKVIDRRAAQRIRAASIVRIMQDEGCIYPIARAKFNAQRGMMRKEIYRRKSEKGITAEAAFLLIQDERNQEVQNP